ncbi:type II toxin-antitoxin system HicA family toxin [Deinococcus cellulosilyticus]|uniref:type II toxin-antitoxin system HicA family toxin n=1 Tax=Deinococcus cellulosilyticus TaxID=401558 RepID=UPI00353112AF
MKYLSSKGFYELRKGKGDHTIWTDGTHTVPIDMGQNPPKKGTFKKMLKDAGLPEDDFR